MNKKVISTARSLKIAIFHLGFFYSGGGEKLVLEEAKGLTQKGHDVTMFAPVVDKANCFPDLIKKVKVRSLFFPFSFYFPLRDFIAITGAVLLTPLTYWRYSRFDIFLGANQPGPLICYFLSKILKKPYVIYLAQPTRLLYPRKIDLQQGFGKGSFNIFYFLACIFRPLVIFLDRLSIQKANAVLVNGSYMAGIIEKVYRVKTIVCSAGCYPVKKLPDYQHRLHSNLKLKNLTLPKPFMLLTNRHYHQKRFDYAIKILSALKTNFPHLSLVITGKPTFYTQELRRLAKKLKVNNSVYFTGLVSEKSLKELYLQAIVYLYTSPEEDFGMGIIEAMASGTPVVSWNKAGPTVTIENGKTGFLCQPHDLNNFIKQTNKLIKNPKLASRLGRASWQRAKLFSYQKHLKVLNRVLLSCTKNHFLLPAFQ